MSYTNIKLVVLDAMGVIYVAQDDVKELLIPFLRRKGCNAPDADIYSLYKECSLGRFSSIEFWHRLQVEESGESLDEEYIQGHVLFDGLLDFLQKMKSHDIPVACISNDVLEWSVKLRKLHNLEKYISFWVISGDAGVRKPDAGIYEILVRNMGYDSRNCIFIDDHIENLDTAVRLGFNTLLFAIDQTKDLSSKHRIISSFREIASLVPICE
jgi:HAD superfamily hydrolase (TIGR01509 family)